MRILVVEDDKATAGFLKASLETEGYAVDTVYTGEKGEELAEAIPYDLIILDIMLPGKNGLEICQSLRKSG